MTISILIGSVATGKTHTAIERIQKHIKDEILSGVFVLLPDRFQVESFRRKLAASGGALGVQVGTFGALYRELLRLARNPVPVITAPITRQLMHSTINAAVLEGKVSYFKDIADKPGFLSVMEERFAELKRAQIRPEDFIELTESHDKALQEIAVLYDAYQEQLREMGWADAEGLNWLAVEALETDHDLGKRWSLLVVDGFDSFFGSQLSAIKLLGERIPDVFVTLPGDPNMDRVAFRRFKRSYEKIQFALPEAEIERLDGKVHLPEALAELETKLFDAGADVFSCNGNISMVEVLSPVEEAREAMRWIKARLVRDGLRPADCVLITPNPEYYRPLLREAASEFGIPIRFTQGEPLTEAAGITALVELLELPILNWPRRALLDAVSSPYFDLETYGIASEDVYALEEVSLQGQVVEGLDEWEEALKQLAAGKASKRRSYDEEIRWPNLPRGDQAKALLESLEALNQRIATPSKRTITEWITWLEDLLDDLAFFERCETPLDRAAALGLRETLRALVVSEDLTGKRKVEYSGFLHELRSALKTATFEEPIDWRQSSVLVLRVLDARGLRFRAVSVLGLSEGFFPEVEREDPFLRDEIREALGLDLRLGREQAGFFYQAVTRSDQFLFLSRPYLAEDGEYWEASPFWSTSASLLAEEPIKLHSEAPRPLTEASSPEELLFWSVRRGALPTRYEEFLHRWKSLQFARDVLETRQALVAEGTHEGDLSNLAERIQEVYGPKHIWSSSRLESYGLCPFYFLSSSTLNLDPRDPPTPGYEPAQLGLVLHEVLERVFPEAADPTDTSQVLKVLPDISEDTFAKAPEKYGFRPTALWKLEQEELLEILETTIEALGETSKGWEPFAYEQRFGYRGMLPLRLSVDGGEVSIGGIIDRVDRNAEGELRIIDYKTGSGYLSGRELISGRRLQLAIYAMGARDALGLGNPVEGLYWMIRAAKAGALKMGSFKAFVDEINFEGPDGVMEMARMHVGRFVAGVKAGRFEPVAPDDGCPPYCPVIGWCWRYRKGWG